MILGCHDSIRSGEWWFLRQPRVPLDEQQACQVRISWPAQKHRRRVRGGEPFDELLISERQDSSDPLQNCPRATGISMADFTSKAARLCFRLRILRLLNTGDFLQRAPLPVLEPLPADQKFAAQRFNFPSAREWQLRRRPDAERWTPDLLCKVSVHNGQPYPAPGIPGWGACVTWLVLNHGMCVGLILMNSFLYAACAVVPAGTRVSGEQQRQESVLAQIDDLCRSDFGVRLAERSGELRMLVLHEKDEFFVCAAACPASVDHLPGRRGRAES